MKATAVNVPRFSAEYWNYTGEQAESGETINTYFKDEDIRCTLVENGGSVMVIYREPLRNNAQLRNVKDRLGNSIFTIDGEDYYVYIGTPQPVFNVFGAVEAYKHTLQRAYILA